MMITSREEVNNLIFVGFSFPSTDVHARILFETASRRRFETSGKEKGFNKVLFCYKQNNNNTDDSIKVLKSVFRNKEEINDNFSNGLEKDVDDILKAAQSS
jgi:hypothetical protein